MATVNQALGQAQIGVVLNDVDTSPQFDLGARTSGEDGLVFTYVKAAEALALSDGLCISPAGLASKVTKALVDKGYQVGCVPAMISELTSIAVDSYFWACISGVQSVNCITGSTASVSPVYTTATAGAFGTASGSQSLVRGIVFSATNSSGATASRAAVLNMPQAAAF